MQCFISVSAATSALLLQADVYVCVRGRACACVGVRARAVVRLVLGGKCFLSLLCMGWCRHSAWESEVERRPGTQGGC